MNAQVISVIDPRNHLKKLKRDLIVLGRLLLLMCAGIAGEALAGAIAVDETATRLQVQTSNPAKPKPMLVLYTTMATWCVACRTELPQFSYLRSVFSPEELAIFGLPYDQKEGAELLKAWIGTNRPPYELLTNLTKDDFASVRTIVLKALKIDAVPASIVTDADGRIVRTRWGPPSVSELRELLRAQRERK